MCGLVGIGFFKTSEPKISSKAVKDNISQFFMTELLVETMKRGENATGIGLVTEDTGYGYIKAGWDANKLLTYNNAEKGLPKLIKWWNKYDVTFAMGHDRKSTVGPEWENNNNHPIHRGNIIMVHNGTIVNQDDIFKEIKGQVDPPKGVVDSEAIAAWLEANYNDKPFDEKGVQTLVSKCDGALTIFCMNRLFPHNVLITRAGRTLVACYNKNLDLVIFLSDETFLPPVIKLWNRHMAREPECGFPAIADNDFEKLIITEDKAMILDLKNPPMDTFKAYLESKIFSIKPMKSAASTAAWTENSSVSSTSYTSSTTYSSTAATKPYSSAATTTTSTSKYAKPSIKECIIKSAIKIDAEAKEIDKLEHKMETPKHPTVLSVEANIDYVGEAAWEGHLDKVSDSVLTEIGEDGIEELTSDLTNDFAEITASTLVDSTALKELIEESVRRGIKEGAKKGADKECDRWASLRKTLSAEIDRVTELASKNSLPETAKEENKLLKTMLLGLIKAGSSGEVPRDKVLDYLVLALSLPEEAIKNIFTSKELETYKVEA